MGPAAEASSKHLFLLLPVVCAVRYRQNVIPGNCTLLLKHCSWDSHPKPQVFEMLDPCCSNDAFYGAHSQGLITVNIPVLEAFISAASSRQ